GETGTGRLSLIRGYRESVAEKLASPPAYAYVENFVEPREPVVVELPAGKGRAFLEDMETLIDNLLATFPAAFENPPYQQKKTAIEREFNQRYNQAIDQVEQKALAMNVSLYRDAESISFSPIEDGAVLDEAQFAQLAQEKRETFHSNVAVLEDYLANVLVELPQWRREIIERTRALNDETITQAIEPLLSPLIRKYGKIPSVLDYLSQVKQDVLKTVIELLSEDRAQESKETTGKKTRLQAKYSPNILVDHGEHEGAPIVYETHPNYQNLFGRVEYVNEQGGLVTGYRHVCPGVLHRANGGYLILDAEKLLATPSVWEALKRALKARQIEIELPTADHGSATSLLLKPQVITLNVKVILIGGREIFYLLQELDSEFNEMFRILADFDPYIRRTDETLMLFARIAKTRIGEEGFKDLTAGAIAELIEYSSRQVENKSRLSARVGDVFEIIGEAELLCRRSGDPLIDTVHVRNALEAREDRTGRLPHLILEEILDGTILIDSNGSAVGKINALTVLEVGDSSFGAPARITATVYPGTTGIVDIEREVELGKAIHSKGVMILSGYLGNKYAQKFPLAISANIALEQSYGYIDGDSASLAEVCAMISALTKIPLSQSFAVTGSINQYGEVQAVGSVNEKIEGFFRLCRARGLPGGQGVIIPTANVNNLMLKQEVIDAVAREQFVIHAVMSVDEALEILTGLPAGKPGKSGKFPAKSINSQAVVRLQEVSELSSETK
ncbi:MAG: ATP-binding protein, partial [Pseudomonadota bacterium]